MKLEHLYRVLALGCMLFAGSCAIKNDGDTIKEDPEVTHPIAVEPSYREIKLQFAGAADGLSTDDAVKFDAFLDDYRTHGNGSLGISVPNGAPAHAAITYFAERAAATGIPRDKILVSTHDVANNDFRVDVSYIAYSAKAEVCGKDWSENLAFTDDNQTPKNFGCSIQHNIAAMVADPRDLLGPRGMTAADTTRRATVMDMYEKGQATQADKHMSDKGSEQSAPGASEVGQ